MIPESGLLTKMSKNLGQYFTVDEDLQRRVCDWVEYRDSEILEPSVGMGHLLRKIYEREPGRRVVAVEIDESLSPPLNEVSELRRGDFLEIPFPGKSFRTIVGNPPYVKRRGKRNLYLDFLDRCFNLLDGDGEMIMIVPSDFFKLTSSIPLLRKMLADGSFTHVYFPESEKLFEGASIQVVCFRYRRGIHQAQAWVDGERRFVLQNGGLVSFSGSPQSGTPLSDLFDIFVGMVSGCDEIFRNEELGNISVRESETGISRFIFYEQLPDEGRALAHLQANKERLMKRGIRAFTEETWFEWGAPRNISKIRSMAGRPCIYVKTLTRSTTVAFIGRVEYFGGGLICLIPKPEFGNKDLQIVVDYLHGEEVNRNFRSGGRFKIGQRHLCNLVLPENPTRD